jgi:hypothetical protein
MPRQGGVQGVAELAAGIPQASIVAGHQRVQRAVAAEMERRRRATLAGDDGASGFKVFGTPDIDSVRSHRAERRASR